jgi:hypothetical protein
MLTSGARNHIAPGAAKSIKRKAGLEVLALVGLIKWQTTPTAKQIM